jgi:hypothetical protein
MKVETQKKVKTWDWKLILSNTPLAMLGLAASFGVGAFESLVYPLLVAVVVAAAFESVYLGAIFFSRNKKSKLFLWTVGAAVSCGVIYNVLYSASVGDDLAWKGGWQWVLYALHGAPLSIVAFLYASLMHFGSDANPQTAQVVHQTEPEPEPVIKTELPTEIKPIKTGWFSKMFGKKQPELAPEPVKATGPAKIRVKSGPSYSPPVPTPAADSGLPEDIREELLPELVEVTIPTGVINNKAVGVRLDELLHSNDLTREKALTMLEGYGITSADQAYSGLRMLGKIPRGLGLGEFEPLYRELVATRASAQLVEETRPEQVRKAEVLARVADMRKVEPGISMRKLAQYVEVSESTLRSWLKNEKTD